MKKLISFWINEDQLNTIEFVKKNTPNNDKPVSLSQAMRLIIDHYRNTVMSEIKTIPIGSEKVFDALELYYFIKINFENGKSWSEIRNDIEKRYKI